MRMYLLVAALVMSMTVAPVLAQDHSQHSTSPTTSEAAKDESTQSELRHIPPDPPEHAMPDMSQERMIKLMEMDDTSKLGRVLLDQLEGYRAEDSNALAWDAKAWYGNDYNKLWLKSEGERVAGVTEGRAELLWDHVFARWWNLQSGIRHDFGKGAARTWAAIGVEGLAPYWFDIETTLYIGDGGRAAARLNAEYELLFTQRLILQPEVEVNLYSKADPERNIGSGLSDLEIGLRLRYEVRREIAPYIGVTWLQRFGNTASLARAAGEDSNDVHIVAGLRLWF